MEKPAHLSNSKEGLHNLVVTHSDTNTEKIKLECINTFTFPCLEKLHNRLTACRGVCAHIHKEASGVLPQTPFI